jgi:phosphoenolpyruvate carboxykinase (GTP)
MERMNKIFENIQMPAAFSEELKAQTERLREIRAKFGEDIISPVQFLER